MNDATWLATKSCRNCGTIVSGDNLREKDSFGGLCPTCEHFNVMRQDSVPLPLAEFVALGRPAAAIQISGSDSDDHESVMREVRALVSAMIDSARTIVSRERAAAVAFLLDSIGHRENLLADLFTGKGYTDPSNTKSAFANRSIQLLYLLLNEGAPLSLADSSGNPDRSHLHKTLWPMLSDLCVLAQMLGHAEAGLLRLELKREVLIAHKTELHTIYQEMQLNLNRVEARFKGSGDPLAKPDYYEAQHSLLGYSTMDIMRLWAGHFAQLKTLTQVIERSGTYFIVTDGLAEPLDRMFDSLTLTLDRLRTFSAPFYFDLGPMRRHKADDVDAYVDVCCQNWTAYYPLYAAVAANERTNLAITSPRALQGALMNIYSVRSHMLTRLVDASKREEFTAVRATVRQLAKQSWARIEAALAKAAQTQGWAADHSIQTVGGADISCGEIDVLLVRRVDDTSVFVLVEAKDIDFPVWKPGFMDRLTQTISRAAHQIESKAEWLTGNWRKASEHLGIEPGARAAITSMVVTRRYVSPGLVEGCAVVPEDAFPDCLARISNGDVAPANGLAGFQVHAAS